MSGKLQLSVAVPCHESWEKMTTTEQGRFCGSCQKTVTDFSMMSDKEIFNHLSQRDVNVCGRFTNDQLNRPLRTEFKRKFSWSYIWNFLIATLLTTASAEAQSRKTTRKASTVLKKDIREVVEVKGQLMGDIVYLGPTSINGTILDNKTNLPIPFASIRNGTELARGVAADSSGTFNISVSSQQKDIVLEISAIGYQSQQLTVAPGSNRLSFYLDPVQEMLEPVVIIAYPTIRCRMVAGGYSISRTVVTSERILRSVADLTPEFLKKKEIKLFPNPVSPGGTLTLALSLKNAGDYTTEILDASGRIVYRGQISVQSKEQNISIPTSSAWSNGIYWVRVMGKDSKKLYHSKLVVQ